mmetsp:Transcript_10044/g.16914  ORF Transcript_10044/g.16914 Transcript_10044/m.16914 type:complete len:127 (+) Transcript_10044:965-1345(+)
MLDLNVRQTKYFSVWESVSYIGGNLKMIQLLIGFLSSIFLYREYASYMVKQLHPGIDDRDKPALLQQFSDRLSDEGLYRLHDRVLELVDRQAQENAALKERLFRVESELASRGEEIEALRRELTAR